MNLNLEKEIQNYTETSRQSEQTITKLYLFFKAFIQDGIKVIDKSKKYLDEYLTELRKEPPSLTNNISFNGFYNDINKYLENVKKDYLSLDQSIVIKIEKLLKKMQNNHNVALVNLSKISLVINENKTKVDKFKNNYFNACKSVLEQEKKMEQLEKDNKPAKKEDLEKNNDLLTKYMDYLNNQEGIYKGEITKLNKMIETNEKVYDKNIKIFKDEYEFKLNCILEILNSFKKEVNNIAEENKDLIPKIEKAYKCIDVEKDINIFSEKNNFKNENKRRFLREKFLNYKALINRRQNEKNNSLNKTLKNVRNLNNFLKIIDLSKKDEIKMEIEF